MKGVSGKGGAKFRVKTYIHEDITGEEIYFFGWSSVNIHDNLLSNHKGGNFFKI